MPMVHTLGHHRLPASITPIPRAPTPVKSVAGALSVMPQVSAATLALVQAPSSEGGGSKLAVVQSPHNLTVSGHNQHGLAVALRASGMPLKAQTPGGNTNPPVQFVPMRAGTAGGSAVTATIRQTIPFKAGGGGGVGVRAPMSSDHAVRVTLVSSANAMSSQAPPTSHAYFKPVTITSQPARSQVSRRFLQMIKMINDFMARKAKIIKKESFQYQTECLTHVEDSTIEGLGDIVKVGNLIKKG